MSKAKVRATFIPNGIGSGNNLKYSIFISIDYSTLASEPSFEDACTFPEFISETKFNLVQNGTLITGQVGNRFLCSEAKSLWNLIFNDTSSSTPNLYFKEKVLPFQTNSPLEYIPKPSKIITHFQSHYVYRVLEKSDEKSFFAPQMANLKTNMDNIPPEIKDIKALINNIHQNPGDTVNTYSSRIQNAQEIHVSEIISFFSSYPELLRRFGLLFSYEINSSLISDGGEIQVQLDTTATPTSTIYEPEIPIPTVVDKKTNLFIAQTKKLEAYRNGLLNLQQMVGNETRFSVVQNTSVEGSYKTDAYLDKAKGFELMEFKYPYDLRNLCNAIARDSFDLALKDIYQELEWLNAFIIVADFESGLYDISGTPCMDLYTSFQNNPSIPNLMYLNRCLIRHYHSSSCPIPTENTFTQKDFINDDLKTLIMEIQSLITSKNFVSRIKLKEDSIYWLNAIMLTNLLPEIIAKKGVVETETLKYYKDLYTTSKTLDNLKRMNRCLLEVYYPELTPKSEDNVPPINTNGIYLIDNFRKEEEGDELNGADKTKLYLEDILTGFRFDLKIVNPKVGVTPSWKSLNAKSSKYVFLKSNQPQQQTDEKKPSEELEEGWTNTDTKAKTKDKDGNDKEVVADILCHINGWGLNTKNPLQEAAQIVKTIEKNDVVPREQGTGDPVHDFLKDKFNVISTSPKSSLQPLRTGLTYQLRARLVTIDGYSISMKEADDFTKDVAKKKPVLRTSDFKFCRLESIGAPVFVLKHAIYDRDECDADKKVKESKRGESEYTLVIRSKNNNKKTNETTERGIAPASISWHLAEWQSAFDTEKEYANINKLKRSKNYLPKIIEKNNKKYWKERTGKFNANGDTNRNIPYIIDPLSQSFEILCDENEIYSLLYCDNPDLNFWKENFDWWNIKTWEIVVKEQRKQQTPGTNRGKNCIFTIDALNKKITILVTKGEDLKFKIRTFPIEEDELLNKHFLPHLIDQCTDKSWIQSQGESNYKNARKNVFVKHKTKGNCYARETLLFAEKEFRVVHAIKKPLFNPKFIDDTTIQRTWYPDELSFALLTSTIFYPGKTAKQLELFANWIDKIDDGISPTTISKIFNEVLVDKYKLNGFIEKDIVTKPIGSDKWLLGDVKENESGVPLYVDTEKTFYAKHNFGDSKHRTVEYSLKATSRFTEFFPAQKENETSNVEFSVFSKSVKLNIPSSQAPAAPKVAFIIPYFEYEFTSNERRRKGNRLRIYLERPWFSSGEDEKLAIIVSNNPRYEEEYEISQAHPHGKYQYVSKWGRDVTTFGGNLMPLTSNNFANNLSVANNLTLNNLLFKQRSYDKTKKEITNIIERPFSAIIFDVKLDDESNCWYADIEFEDVNSYFPFIQLSVARYQKDSIADEELSSSILCDFIQVAPTRTISYHKQGDYIDLSLFGSDFKADFDSATNKTVIKNEVYVAFIKKENSQEGSNDILYSSNGDTPDTCDWHKIEEKDITVLENGIVWRFKGVYPYSDYTILVKEFEVFHNSLDEVNPEKNPTKRLTFGDAIEL